MTPAVPELGPALGGLGVPGEGALAGIRLALATAIFEAAGAAREGRSLDGLMPASWRAQWEAAVRQATAAVVTEAEAGLHAAAAESRLPRRRLARLALTEAERHGIAARLGAEGTRLVRTLRDSGDSPLEGEALVRAARELDAAWTALEEAAAEERVRWQGEAARVRNWRRPRWPVVLGAAAGALLFGWLGLVLGGWIPAPAFLVPLRDAITALP